MVQALAPVLPLILAGVFVASGIGKLRVPDDADAWADLGVPRVLRRAWLVRAHPWGELALGVALSLLGGLPGVIVSGGALALLVGYLALVLRARLRSPDASCACFGARSTITGATVARNGWLVALAAATVLLIGANPVAGGALLAIGWPRAATIVAASLTVLLVMWAGPQGTARGDSSTGGPATPGAGELDYIRTRTPALPVTLADGTTTTLRRLADLRPQLIVSLSESCGPCREVLPLIPEWRTRLPEVDVRVLVQTPPGTGALSSTAEPQSLHDVGRYVIDSITDGATPSAVLLGADGMLAGGPVSGSGEIRSLVDDIYDSLHEAD